MAQIGLTNLWYGLLTEAEDGTPSYAGAKSFGKAVSAKVDVSTNDATLYADDALAESDNSFQSAKVTLGVADDDMTIFAEILGHKVAESGGEMVRSADDAAPWVGLGRVVTKMVNGKYVYKGEFLYKVRFAEPSQEDNTKGESVDFSTPEIEGTAATLANGDWSAAQVFDTKSAAVEWVKGKLAAKAGGTSVTTTGSHS
nr:MAG TPA: tail tube protein [Caudoviricetes sp.]